MRAIPELRINAASERDWLDSAMNPVEVDGHDVPLPVLYPALVGGQPYLEFGSVVHPTRGGVLRATEAPARSGDARSNQG